MNKTGYSYPVIYRRIQKYGIYDPRVFYSGKRRIKFSLIKCVKRGDEVSLTKMLHRLFYLKKGPVFAFLQYINMFHII